MQLLGSSCGRFPAPIYIMSFEYLAYHLWKSLQICDNNKPSGKRHDLTHFKLTEAVYGRICTTYNLEKPAKLSLYPGRKTAFVFGPETVTNTVLSRKPYDVLLQLGYLPEYIHLKVCKDHRSFWLVVFRSQNLQVMPATWDGVMEFIKVYYPSATESVLRHLPEMKTHSVEFYEKQSGIKFIQAIKEPPDDTFMSYLKYTALEEPKAWQTRLFLYCELKLFELFEGDGFTKFEDGTIGEKEYICPNVDLDSLGEKNCIILPMNIVVPEDVKRKYEDQ